MSYNPINIQEVNGNVYVKVDDAWSLVKTDGASTSLPDGGNVKIGDRAHGGIVAYIWSNGQSKYIAGETHGYVVSIEDLGCTQWGYTGTTNATGQTFGTGMENTEAILASGLSIEGNKGAAAVARNYRGGGYSDWFLPSLEEMLWIMPVAWSGYTVLHTEEEGTITFYGKYQTSSAREDSDVTTNWGLKTFYSSSTWDNGNPFWKGWDGNDRLSWRWVRAIRYF